MRFVGRKTGLLALALSLVLVTAPLAAMEKAEMINGTHWSKWSEGDKLIYIRGITNPRGGRSGGWASRPAAWR